MPNRFFSKSSLVLFSLISVRSSIFDGSLKWFGTDPTDAKFPEPIPIFKSTHSNVESLTSLEISLLLLMLLLLMLLLVGAIVVVVAAADTVIAAGLFRRDSRFFYSHTLHFH